MRPLVAVIIGVAGTGKTTIGRLVAVRTGWPFADADDMHSPANIAKMRAGTPLTDADRGPWLREVAAWTGARLAGGTGGIIACSALRRRYRDIIRDGHTGVCFVCLTAPADLLRARLTGRPGYFMPASLLESQLADFEPLKPGEPGGSVDASGPADQTAAEVLDLLARHGG
jgi:gluconokinase